MTVTALEPAIERGRIALRKPDATLKDVVEKMAEDLPTIVYSSVEEFPPPAPVLEITPEQAEALIALPAVFGQVQPGVRRSLSEDEIRALYDEREVLRKIMACVATRDEAIKETMRHHMDVDAEERGVAVPKAVVDEKTGQVIVEATDRTKEGHYILCGPQAPERTPIPKTNLEWSREYRKGTVSTRTSPDEMLDLLNDGVIDRDAYLAMTREVRVFDETKALSAAVHSPDLRDQIIRAIKAMTSVGKPSVSLFIRKPKK